MPLPTSPILSGVPVHVLIMWLLSTWYVVLSLPTNLTALLPQSLNRLFDTVIFCANVPPSGDVFIASASSHVSAPTPFRLFILSNTQLSISPAPIVPDMYIARTAPLASPITPLLRQVRSVKDTPEISRFSALDIINACTQVSESKFLKLPPVTSQVSALTTHTAASDLPLPS